MKTRIRTQPLAVGIIAGFSIILALMLALVVISLSRLAEVNQRLEHIQKDNNVKTELTHTMKDRFRERSVSMHIIALSGDAFEQNAEFVNFTELGVQFAGARAELEAMILSPEEKAVLTRMRAWTVKTQPVVFSAIEAALMGETLTAQNIIRSDIIPLQKLILQEIQSLLAIQQRQTEEAVADAARTYADTRLLLVVLGLSALLLGVVIAVFVIRHTTSQAKLLQDQAMFDSLTGLPNRALFYDRVEQAILRGRREVKPFSIMVLDLNRFKEVNDTHGHHVGDLLLKAVGGRLKEATRSSDTVARMGGDEFAILLPGTEMHGTKILAEKIRTQIKNTFMLDAKSLNIDTSIGSSHFPNHGDDFDILMQRADIAMYTAKRAGMGVAQYVTDDDRRSATEQALKGELAEAIANDQMVLHYQPKVNYRLGQVTGVEALVRWQHPQHGLIAPDRFIHLAEESGLIRTLTLWVLKHALKECAALQAAGINVNMAVNLSALNLRDPTLPEALSDLLEEAHVNSENLELEFSETAVMADTVRTMDVLARLYSLGTKLSIDDYGTGYSTLAYLKQIPLHRVKIDKSVVAGIASDKNNEGALLATIERSHELGLRVVAEGVEDAETMASLGRLGCDSAQGYHICKPLDEAALMKWLKESRWKLGRAP